MTNKLDDICQAIKDLYVNSKGETNNEAFGFNEIVENSKRSRNAVGTHLKEHLLKTGYISRDFDRKYRWNMSQQLYYTPSIIHKLYKFEITIKPPTSPSTTTLEFINNLKDPLLSYCWYCTSINPVTWEKMNPTIILKHNGADKTLYHKKRKPCFLIKNPYFYKFIIDFQQEAVYQDESASLILKLDRFYSPHNGFIPLYPDGTTQQIEFNLNCPSTDYKLQVYHINKKTGQQQLSPIKPSTQGKQITWQNDSHNLEYYYQFVWQKP